MNLFNQLKKINSQLFPYLGTIILAASIIESVSYTGIFAKYYHVSLFLFIFLGVISAILFVLDNISVVSRKIVVLRKVKQSSDIFFTINRLLLLVLVIVYALLSSIEKSHYPNYIFTTFHINFPSLAKSINISIVFLITQLLSQKINSLIDLSKIDFNNKIYRSTLLRSVIFILIVMLTTYYAGKSLINIIIVTTSSNQHILTHLNATYDDKMREYWPGMYDYMLFIKNLTPDNATILLPPQQSPWLTEGNAGLIRYFLYPRKVINGNLYSLSDSDFQYVLIAHGSWGAEEDGMYGWPKVATQAEQIWYWNDKTNEVIPGDTQTYKPGDTSIDRQWGLIQVKEY